MIVANTALTTCTFSPMTWPIAWASSGSQPMTLPFASLYSSGAYDGSVTIVSVPLDLMAAGSFATTAASADELVFGLRLCLPPDEEPPHPAATKARAAQAATRAAERLSWREGTRPPVVMWR